GLGPITSAGLCSPSACDRRAQPHVSLSVRYLSVLRFVGLSRPQVVLVEVKHLVEPSRRSEQVEQSAPPTTASVPRLAGMSSSARSSGGEFMSPPARDCRIRPGQPSAVYKPSTTTSRYRREPGGRGSRPRTFRSG